MTRPNRFALYYRLIDASFACHLILLAAAFFKAITGTSAVDGVLRYPFAAVFLFAIIVPPVLIFQRWMRDDFSEMLWQKTAGTVLKALVLLPFPVMIAVIMAFVSGNATANPTNSSNLSAEAGAALSGFSFTMIVVWFVGPLLFTLAFQWHRWRASR